MRKKIVTTLVVVIGLLIIDNHSVFAQTRTVPVSQDPDINIRVRGWNYTPNFPNVLRDHPNQTQFDPGAPQLSSSFDNHNFTAFYQVKDRNGQGIDSSQNLPDGTVPGMASIQVNPGQNIRAPVTTYQVAVGYNYVILYATDNDIVIHIGLEDTVANGYTLHFLNINVDPLLKHLYDQNEANGRKQLVALACLTVLGTARADTLVSVRDTGSFMDIRYKDWWNTTFPGTCSNTPPGVISVPATPGTGPTQPNTYTPPEVPCDASNAPPLSDPEYHSLRPYPASPCYKKVEATAMTCGNDLIVKKTFHETPNDKCSTTANGTVVCKYEKLGVTDSVSINLKNAKLPIVGNTEDVPNGTWTSTDTNANNFTAAQRMNNYVSWYLNGVINRAEADFSSHDPYYLVNLSGPLNKLLPWDVQAVTRISTIIKAVDTVSHKIDAQNDSGVRHNQIVGCLFPDSLGGVGQAPCYLFNRNYLIDLIHKISQLALPNEDYVTYWVTVIKSMNRLVDWNAKPEYKKPVESDYRNIFEYWLAYQKWLGKVCVEELLGTNYFLCLNLGVNNLYSMLFNNIPLSSTEDRVGKVMTDVNGPNGQLANTIQLKNGQGNGGDVTNVSFNPTSDTHNLYFAHMQEDTQLAKMLQSTYAAKSDNTNNWEAQLQGAINNQSLAPMFNTYGCERQEVRTNPGDNLYGDVDRITDTGKTDQQITGTLKYDASFTCEFKPQVDPTCVASGRTDCTTYNVCDKDIYASLAIYTKTPGAYELSQRLVDGAMGVFKRFFPKVGPSAPIDQIKDIPGAAKVTYASDAETRAGVTGRQGTDAQLFFPHLGSLEEYFLQGIQKALRPKDVTANAAPVAGQPLQCKAGSNVVSHAILNSPPAFITENTIATALTVAKVTCTPAEILIGIMAKESRGLANGDTPYTGDPNEIGTRNCAGTNNNCGAYSFANIDIAAAYKYRPDQMNACLTALGLQPGETDQKKLGVSLCAAGTEFWSGSVCAAKNPCDGQEHSLSSMSDGQIENAALEFHAKDCDPSASGRNKDSDGAWKYYQAFIQAYAGDVARIRASCQK